MRSCTQDGCSNSIRSNNTTGYCPDHKYQWQRDGSASPRKPSQKKNAEPTNGADVRERFEQLAKGLGKDPEQLISTFCEGWVANIQAAAESALNPEAD